MRHSCVYDRPDDWEVPVKAAMRQLGQFENLFKNMGGVHNGFPDPVDLAAIENRDEYNPKMLHDHLMFGTPDQVIEKLRAYDELGVDHFTYYASLGLGRPRHAGAEALPRAVHQGGHAGLRIGAERPRRLQARTAASA
jgi:alkanesulfonate monooxygenase SsuD/methylene tetrahydromethanopterin reductase-like flavin-dependent oxidoreductase (luciferase family)